MLDHEASPEGGNGSDVKEKHYIQKSSRRTKQKLRGNHYSVYTKDIHLPQHFYTDQQTLEALPQRKTEQFRLGRKKEGKEEKNGRYGEV